MRLERRGTRDGMSGLPSPGAVSLSEAEREVVARIGDLRKKGLAHYDLQIDAYASRIRGVRGERENVEVEAGQFRTALEVESQRCANHLYNAIELVMGHHARVEAYRRRHRLVGPPDEPKNAVYMIGFILIVFVIEVALSGTLFADKNMMGLVGGMGIAIVISGVNVVACLLCGLGTRYVNLRSPGSKLFGGMAFLLFLGIFVGLNLTVAHFRDALELHEWDEAAFQAIISLRENVLGIDSFNSWIVAAFGGIVSVISFIEGLIWYDRHPGFNRTFNALQDAVRGYARQYGQAQDQLEEVFANARDGLKGHARRMRAGIQSAVDAVEHRSTLTRQLDMFLEDCDRAVNLLHARYRDSNIAARTEPPPKHFDEEFSYGERSHRGHAPRVDTLEAKAEIEKVDQIVESGVSDILRTRERAISAFPTVRQLRDRLHGSSIYGASGCGVDKTSDGAANVRSVDG